MHNFHIIVCSEDCLQLNDRFQNDYQMLKPKSDIVLSFEFSKHDRLQTLCIFNIVSYSQLHNLNIINNCEFGDKQFKKYVEGWRSQGC